MDKFKAKKLIGGCHSYNETVYTNSKRGKDKIFGISYVNTKTNLYYIAHFKGDSELVGIDSPDTMKPSVHFTEYCEYREMVNRCKMYRWETSNDKP